MVNAHDEPRGLYLFDWLGSRRPRTTDKKKVPRFFMPASQRKENRKNVSPLGLGQKKKQIQKDKENYYTACFSRIIDFGRQNICPKRWFLAAP